MKKKCNALLLIQLLVLSALTIRAQSTLNVKSFGAKGDGETNDSAAFQQAIIAASKQGTTLFVPKGTYIIANLLAYPNTYLKGEDNNSVLKLSPSNGNKRKCLILDKNSNNTRWENIVFDANGQNIKGPLAYCVWTNLPPGQIRNLTFSNCVFTNSKGYGALFLIGTTGSIQNVVITNCTFINTGSAAMHIRGVDHMTFTNNRLTRWATIDKNNAAVSFESQESRFVVFENNHFQNKGASYFAIECAGAYVRNSQFIGNIFDGDNMDASGVSGYFSNCLFEGNRHLKGGGSHRSGYELVGDYDTIRNTYIDNGTISLGTTSPIPTDKGGNGYFITDDTIIEHTANGMCIGIGGVDVVRNAVIKNNILNNKSSTGSASAIYIGARGGVQNILISGNIFYGQTNSPCIRYNVTTGNTEKCDGVIVTKNKFIGWKGIQIDHPEIWTNLEFSNNDFKEITGQVFNNQSLPNASKIEGNRMPPGQ